MWIFENRSRRKQKDKDNKSRRNKIQEKRKIVVYKNRRFSNLESELIEEDDPNEIKTSKGDGPVVVPYRVHYSKAVVGTESEIELFTIEE